LIVAVSVIVWAAAYYPHDTSRLDPSLSEGEIAGTLLAQSYLGQLGRWIEPAVKPLGWDWRIGCAALASFPAREVVVATLGVIYNLGADVDEESDSLKETLQNATWDASSRRVFNVPVALSLMVFFALCAQCASTLVVMRRETNSWRWPAFTFAYMTMLAYCGALVTYQAGMLFVK
jgi:ferrous iron transport protein B